MRSRAYELLANSADDDEIAAAITPELRAELPLAYSGIHNELVSADAHDAFEDALAAELGKYMRLTAGGWAATERVEWIIGATEELRGFPLSMLIPQLAVERRREPWPNKLVPKIVEALEPRLAKLKHELDQITRLSEIASK